MNKLHKLNKAGGKGGRDTVDIIAISFTQMSMNKVVRINLKHGVHNL